MPSRLRPLPAGFVVPCLPTRAPRPPYGAIWLHEIEHDGFRVIARKEGKRVRLYSRPGNDLTHRFPLIVEALGNLCSRSCIIDGEAVSCGPDGIASFDRIRYRRHDGDAVTLEPLLPTDDRLNLPAGAGLQCRAATRWHVGSLSCSVGEDASHNALSAETPRLLLMPRK